MTSISSSIRLSTLQVASWLTEPCCKVRECYYELTLIDTSSCSRCAQLAGRVKTAVALVFYAIIAPLGALVGTLLRSLAANCGKNYIEYTPSDRQPLQQSPSTLSLTSYNICLMPGGYAITDGQVTPPKDHARLERILNFLTTQNSDVICLNEVPDIRDAKKIADKLKGYAHFILQAGPRTVGPSSMIVVASKYKLSNISFTPFIKKEELTGRAANSEKGVLGFDLCQHSSKQNPFCRVLTTHLQHSEIPDSPTADEVQSRSRQIQRINTLAQQIFIPTILTGDLNMNEQEWASLKDRVSDWNRDPHVLAKATWSGDAWCAQKMNKQPSTAQVLDYTCLRNGAAISTTIHPDPAFDTNRFVKEANSDHCALTSTLTFTPF